MDYMSLIYDKILKETSPGEKKSGAILFLFGDREQWIPKSLIDPDILPLEEDGAEVILQYWFIEKNGLEAYLA